MCRLRKIQGWSLKKSPFSIAYYFAGSYIQAHTDLESFLSSIITVPSEGFKGNPP